MMTTLQIAQLRSPSLSEGLTLSEYDAWIALVEGERADRLTLQKEITATLPPPEQRRTRFTIRDAEYARADLHSLLNGVSREAGVTHPRLLALVGQPGLAELDRWATRLRAKREQEAARPVLVWPRKFQYTGKLGKHEMNGRFVVPGEVIELTEPQAASWADRFEAVEQEAADA